MNIIGNFAESDLWTKDALTTMKNIVAMACAIQQIPANRVEVSVNFVSTEEIRELNKTYRGIDKATDVLSFPQFEADEAVPPEGPIFLGDVIICNEVCKEQATRLGHSEEREFTYLFAHSILHLMGYDHMEKDEKDEMRSKEKEILVKALGEQGEKVWEEEDE